MPHGGHSMIHDARRWHRISAEAVGSILGTGLPIAESAGGPERVILDAGP
ncbi:hypothetical protein ACFYYB_35425 [Streptomyces sp. NPDC002886]